MKIRNWLAVPGTYVVYMIGSVLIDSNIRDAYLKTMGPMPRIGWRIYQPEQYCKNLILASILLNLFCGYLVEAWAGLGKMSHAKWLAGLIFWTEFFLSSTWTIYTYPAWYFPALWVTCLFFLVGGWLEVKTVSYFKRASSEVSLREI